MFDKIDGLIKVHNRNKYLVLFDYGWCDEVCNNIKYLISEKSGINWSMRCGFF